MIRIAPQTGTAFRLAAGRRLRLTTPTGGQVADLFCFRDGDPEEAFSAGRTLDYADSILIRAGHRLFSNRSRPMLTLEHDDCGRHDLLLTPCSREMFRLVGGHEDHPSCDENLARALTPFGFTPGRIGTTFNVFMNVAFAADGGIRILPPLARPGASVVLRAEMDLVVGLTACSHEETNAGVCKEILYRLE